MTVERNIIYWGVGDLVDKTWPTKNCILDNNLYWNAAGLPVKFKELSFAQWQASGQDVHSIIADPMFENPEKGDFRLKPGSPAEKIGFKPFDYSKAGVYGDERWLKEAASVAYPPVRFAPPPPK